MRSPLGRNIISLLFLSAFFLLRIVNTHALSHCTDEIHTNDCELCEIITISNQFTPIVDQAPEEYDINPIVLLDNNRSYFHYEAPLHCFVCPIVVHNKPPPGT